MFCSNFWIHYQRLLVTKMLKDKPKMLKDKQDIFGRRLISIPVRSEIDGGR